MTIEDRVLYFITSVKKRTGTDYYLKGHCYDFYFILLGKFHNAECFYDSNHVITKIEDKYYDITGEVKKGRHLPVDGKHYSHTELEKWFKV